MKSSAAKTAAAKETEVEKPVVVPVAPEPKADKRVLAGLVNPAGPAPEAAQGPAKEERRQTPVAEAPLVLPASDSTSAETARQKVLKNLLQDKKPDPKRGGPEETR